MGYGYWRKEDFISYSKAQGRKVNDSGRLDPSLTDRQIFRQSGLSPLLSPENVMRECCDSSDHPQTKPVILALDVTGSMGPASAEVAKTMNEVMTGLYRKIQDVEFMVMGIGDLSYDRAPIQISQFESDIRIAEQLDRVYLEHGGGGNAFESYTAAWYMGLYHTRLDCWKRNRKGLIITMGDEPLNPYLPREPLSAVTGDRLQGDVETKDLYREVQKKFDIRHLHVQHREYDRYLDGVRASFGQLLPKGCLEITDLNSIGDVLVRIICTWAGQSQTAEARQGTPLIRWGTWFGPDKPERREEKHLISW